MTITIYRMTDGDDTFDGLADTEKITLSAPRDEGIPDDLLSLQTYNIEMNRTDTDNPAPFQEEARKPDTGFKGTRYNIGLYFDPGSGAIARLRDWFAETNKVRGAKPLPNGRLGIRDTDHPQFDLHPTRRTGLKLARFSFDFMPHEGQRKAILVLELSGKPDRLGIQSPPEPDP